jgi:hypothetical protein
MVAIHEKFRRASLASFLSPLALVLVLHTSSTKAALIEVPGVGDHGNGADVVITNLDSDPRPDMILMAYDAPDGPNNFRYRVGLNLNADGATTFGDIIEVTGVGWDAQGAGAAITNLDSDPRPELILMAYDAPSGPNSFRYKVGSNLDPSGKAQSWGPMIEVAGLGNDGQGADVLVTNLDDDGRPDIILMAYDKPPQGGNTFRYKIGWNVDSAGVTQTWDGPIVVPGVGQDAQGAGATLANLDNDPRPELILMAYDNPPGANDFRFRVCWNLGTDGRTTNCDNFFTTHPGLGDDADGAGLALVGMGERPHLLLMAYDARPGPNIFRYDIRRDFTPAQGIWLEMDKLSSVTWPAELENRFGASFTLHSIFLPLGLDVRIKQDQGNISPPLNPAGVELCFTDADLDAFLTANRNTPPFNPADWHMYAAILKCHTTPNLLGQMFDTEQRRGFAVFTGSSTASMLRNIAHELGHALCLFHEDAFSGVSIMNQDASTNPAGWNFTWSASEMHPIWDRSRHRWAPISGGVFPTTAACATTAECSCR